MSITGRRLWICELEAKMDKQQETSDDWCALAGKLDSAGILRSTPLPKFNSFACACCRLIWDELPPLARQALVVAEKYVSGDATSKELTDERVKLWQDLGDESNEYQSKKNNAYRAVTCSLYVRGSEDSIYQDYDVVCYVIGACNRVKPAPNRIYFDLLHKVFGNPPK
jgi:hypothetical protein